MILLWLFVIPVVGGALAWFSSRWGSRWPRWVSLAALTINLAIVLALWIRYRDQFAIAGAGPWLVELNQENWIPQLGIGFHLGMDGLSLLLVMLTAFLGIMAVIASWTEIEERVGFFHFNLMWVLAGITGVFLALDLFLFYFFWELMLIPMYFIIALWGHENRRYASFKFFLFTQASGVLMLIAILALYFIHGRNTGTFTFDFMQLLGTSMSGRAAMWLMLGLFIAFAVKLPAVPVHTWLPDAHTEAPTAGSVILAGLLLKTGAYGLIRFVVPLFPQAAFDFTNIAMALAVAGILYGAILAFAQTDFKRLVAYTSISHMGFVLLGVFAWNELALQGAVMQIITHGLATGALFVIAGALQERMHTRDMRRMGGLWSTIPRMGGAAMFFGMAALGLPGLGNFVGEFLVLVGVFQTSIVFTALAALGLIAATVYALWMVQAAFHGPNREGWRLPDLSLREMVMMGIMAAVIVWLGLYPQPVLNMAKPSLDNLQQYTIAAQNAQPPQEIMTIPQGSGSQSMLIAREVDDTY